jgi:Raf kinase inhibitor-like YbhB/YbcL family protein
MQITSAAFEHDGMLPSSITCDGQGTSPPLSIHGVPQGARSLTLIVDDPDAPSGTFVHWVLWSIPAVDQDLREDSSPAGAEEGLNSLGKTGYVPPCPPSGTHHYRFRLSALDTVLTIASPPSAAALERAMEGHVIATAELVGLYRRR